MMRIPLAPHPRLFHLRWARPAVPMAQGRWKIWYGLLTILLSLLCVPDRCLGSSSAKGEPAEASFGWVEAGLLPFPSNLYTVPDPSTPTGLRIRLPKERLPQSALDKAPFDPTPVLDRMQTLDGFSPVMPIMVAIPGLVDETQVPTLMRSADPQSLLWLLDLNSGQRLTFRHRLFPVSTGDEELTVILLSPEDRLENRGHYGLVLRRGWKTSTGASIEPRQLVIDGLNGCSRDQAPPWYAYAGEVGAALSRVHVPLEEVAFAFDFTVASSEHYTAALSGMASVITSHALVKPYFANRFKLRRVRFNDEEEVAFRGKGTFEVLRFIGPKGEHLASPISQEVDFRLELPASCPPGGCPVAIFGHGLGATKETMLQVSDQFARRGIATIGVSAPWHGNWIAPLKVLLGAHRNLDLLHGLFIAHITRNLQLVQLLKQDLGRFAMPLDRAGGPIIKLRSDRILYIGQSMGGICGVATTALSPDIQVALFDVTGGAAVDLFFDSHVARMMRLPAVDMPGLTVAETLAVAPLAMYLFDDMDPLGFAPHLIRSPLGEARPRLIAQHAGRGDGLVPNWTTEKLARAIGLEILRGPEDAAAPVKPVRGPGLRYFKFGNNYFLAHLSLVTEKSSTAAANFFDWGLKELDKTHGITPGNRGAFSH